MSQDQDERASEDDSWLTSAAVILLNSLSLKSENSKLSGSPIIQGLEASGAPPPLRRVQKGHWCMLSCPTCSSVSRSNPDFTQALSPLSLRAQLDAMPRCSENREPEYQSFGSWIIDWNLAEPERCPNSALTEAGPAGP